MKRILTLVLGVCLLLGLCACGGGNLQDQLENAKSLLTGDMTASEAKELAEGNLSAIYYGVVDDSYLQMVGETTEGIRESYENGLETEVAFFEQYFEIEYDNDELHTRIHDLYDKIYPKSRFSVGEATKNEAGDFVLTVTVQPLDIMELATDKLNERMDDFNAKYDDAAYASMDEAAYQAYDADWADFVITAVEDSLGDMDYLPERTVDVTVSKEDGYWCLTDDSISDVDTLIIAY